MERGEESFSFLYVGTLYKSVLLQHPEGYFLLAFDWLQLCTRKCKKGYLEAENWHIPGNQFLT
jgi:hypothetical protein